MKYDSIRIIYLLTVVLFLASCSSRRFVPYGDYMLEKVTVTADNPALKGSGLEGYVRQHPNSRWFGVLKAPMLPYLMQGSDTTKSINRFLRRIGEKPVIYDKSLAMRTSQDLSKAAQGMGFRGVYVETRKKIKGHKISIEYSLNTKGRMYVSSIDTHFPDTVMKTIYDSYKELSYLRSGMPFDVNILDKERSRVVAMFLNKGYYKFNRSHVRYLADTLTVPGAVSLTLQVLPYRENGQTEDKRHIQFRIDSVYFNGSAVNQLRQKVLDNACKLRTGDLYTEQAIQQTYSSLDRLGNVISTVTHFVQTDSALVDADIVVNTARTHSLQMSPEATNTSGDIGAALGLTYQNRNFFHGGETFSFKLRGAFEAVKGLDGYAESGFYEYSAETTLSWPMFQFPFVSSRFRHNSLATTELGLMYDSQDRPEFHRRVLTGALRYRWNKYNKRMQHRLDMLDLNYIFMPWISDTFRRDYLDDSSSRNSLLRYNYENLFIMKMGYTYSYVSRRVKANSNIRRNSTYALRASVESAGNLLRAFSAISNNKVHNDGYLHFLGIAYAQYIKGDIDYSRMTNVDDRTQIAMHAYLGIAYPYGNSRVLPYEKRYFSGGANSVRGWSVRALGPGRFRGNDGRIDFINQTGDVKLDLSVELRSRLFWKVGGALFVDAGNIWTIRDYEEQSGGQFRFDRFLKQIAVAYGLGLRFNFDYFVVRLDAGMKAINPAYEDSRKHYPILHPNLKRDCAIHFAVGLPF